jgi:superfamily II DNA or RNA helicase
VVEAKDNNHTIGDGMQQGLDYAESLQVPFVFSSNGDGFLYHDNTAVDLGGDLLVMATGTGKTYTAFQIIWRLWKSRQKKRILFLADRNILVDQTRTNDFKPFGSAMTKISKRQIDKSFEIYLALYQAVTGTEEDRNIYKQFSPDFFDLIVVDECHRGSAAADSAWREILNYFSDATQIGLTATPKETKDVSNIDYFGKPIYTYSLKQGIDDGFLAPYKVHRIDFDKDVEGWRPTAGQKDSRGNEIEDRIYNQKDMESARDEWLKGAPDDATRKEWDRSDFLKCKTEDGYADFHALRHGFVSRLASSGVHPKVAKELARHSTITLTMDRYAHVELDEMARGVNSLESSGDLVALEPVQTRTKQELSLVSAQQKTPQNAGFPKRRRPDSNRGWWICNPLP